ncbi:MAG: Hsp70 family protein [SAR324 cluster bacterium]|nr:Hsp70 family protein [SAR324 cluster bacterium]
MNKTVCGVDFGTSNSTIGVNDGTDVRLIPFKEESYSIPSVLLWLKHNRQFLVGNHAVDQFTDGEDGRFFRSLKRYLGEAEEISTLVGTRASSAKRYYLRDLISIILASMKKHTEEKINRELSTILLGRPVHYNDSDAELDRQAEERMRSAAAQAGFENISFEYEPVAAALSYESTLQNEEYVLVGDIGGGTSDFSIVKVGPQQRKQENRKNDILGNAGVYVGGDTFDSHIMYEHVTPFLGRGSKYNTGNKMLDIPGTLFSTVSQWHLIHFLKDRQTLEQIQGYITFGEKPKKLKRLKEVVEVDLGYDLFNVVERFKFELTKKEAATLHADFFEDPFSVEKTRQEFDQSNQSILDRIENSLLEVLRQSSLTPQQIDSVSLVGGSTLIPSVRKIFSNYFAQDVISNQNVFTSVGYGLSLASRNLL